MDPKFILPNDDSRTSDITDSSISSTSTNNSKKKRGKSRRYYFSSEHQSFSEAKKVIDDENIWTALTPKINTHYYRCKKVVCRSSTWCSAAVYILKHEDSNKASIYRTICEYLLYYLNLSYNQKLLYLQALIIILKKN